LLLLIVNFLVEEHAMLPSLLANLKRQPVEIEYCPPGRTNPEMLTRAMGPILWDLFDDGRLALVVLRVHETIGIPIPPQGTPATQSNVKEDRKQIYNFIFKWLQTEHIASIRTNGGFHIDRTGRKIVDEEPEPFYPEPTEQAYAALWNAGIWKRIEKELVRLGLREEPIAPPEVPTEQHPVQPAQPEQSAQPAQPDAPSADPALNPFAKQEPAQAVVQPQPQAAPEAPPAAASRCSTATAGRA
jgi:hypothetical protein